MTQIAIRLEKLNKTFGKRKKRVQAVIDNTLEVAAGQVYGFLGPNGAGKTTVIRMLLDLIQPTSGRAYIFDQPVYRNIDVLRRVGAMVEGPVFYPYLTGEKNLRVLARSHGWESASPPVNDDRIRAVLAQVELTDAADRRFRTYSLGMKQRLGLAAALLHDPALVILDEPTNGLDPAGIQEMRYFIRRLVDDFGKTVFLSSHLLNEVEQVCDRVAIIREGRIIQEGRVGDLLQTETRLRLRVSPVETARASLRGVYPTRAENGHLLVDAQPDDAPKIARLLVDAGTDLYELTPHKQSLEDYFLSVTRKADHAEPVPR